MKFYNNESIKLQNEFDSRKLADQLLKTRCHYEFSTEESEWINNSTFFFIASVSSEGNPDCSIKGGRPGFVKVISNDTLQFEDYDGNGMFRTIGNILENNNVGILFIDLEGEGRKLRINGKANIEKKIVNGIVKNIKISITANYIFPNCPRYLPKSDGKSPSIYSPGPGYTPPSPLWKSKPDLKPYLPKKGNKNESFKQKFK